MAWYLYPLLLLAGLVAGFVNVLAGNGSLITLPVLLFVGLPANVANATNRLGVLLQSVVGAAGFHRREKLDLRGAVLLSIPMALGTVIGASCAVDVDEAVFRRVLALMMLVMLVAMMMKPERWMTGSRRPDARVLTPGRAILFFAIGLYAGFLQAGVGILLLAALVLGTGYDAVRANAVKLAIIVASASTSLIVFSVNLKVDWQVGAVLALGNMTGAWLASRYATDRGAAWVRRFVIAIVLVSSAYLLGLFDLIGRLL